MQVKAFSLTQHVNDWLAKSRHPRVLHIFDRVCNLINERGEVLSIVMPQLGNGPFNLVLPEEIRFSDDLHLESPVSISPTQLILGHLTLYTTEAKLWNPHPDWEVLHARKDDIVHQLLQLPTLAPSASAGVTNYLNSGGLNLPFAKTTQGYSTNASTQSLISSLSSSFAFADLHSSLTAIQKLAGLGVGLTPAGDDFIMGALYAAWIIHPREVATILTEAVTNTAALLTTSLSASWLRSAGRGEAGALWHEFFDALISKDHMRIEESKNNILAVGETSGTDALVGFTSVFASWMEK